MFCSAKKISILGLCLVVVFSASVTLAEEWEKFIPQVSQKWGPNDEIGNANYMTPEKTLEVIKLVKTGKVYDMGMVYYPGMPAYPPRTYKNWLLVHSTFFPKGINKATDMEEFFCLSAGIGTQLDGLAHVGTNLIFYNNTPVDKIVSAEGAKKFGMEKVPPIVTRGVFVDMVAYKGRYLEGGEEITVADLEGALKKQGVSDLRPGDAVIFHTDWMRWVGVDDKKFMSSSPGVGQALARYLVEKGVVGVGTDQWSTEHYPHGDYFFPVHTIFLGNGVYHFQNLVTAEVAEACKKDGKYDFLFIFTHPKYKGTTQGNGQPIAIK
jgi:kynurenine formamidase